MNRKAAAACLLAAAGAVGWLLLRNGVEIPRGVIAGNGIIETTEVEVSSRIFGRVRSVTVREGDSVSRGDLVAALESGEVEGQLHQAEGNLAAAEAALAEVRAGTRSEELRGLEAQAERARMLERQAEARVALILSGAREEEKDRLRAAVQEGQVTLDDAAREYERKARLHAEGAVATAVLDASRTRRDLAAARLEAAERSLDQAVRGARGEEIDEAKAARSAAGAQARAAKAALDLARAGPRKETVEAAEARVRQARGALEVAGDLLEQTEIRAPLDGRVTLRSVEPGEVVTPGLPIVRVAGLADVWLRMYVPEDRVGLVKLGQPAEVTVDSYPGRTFRGEVVEIAEEPEFTPKNIQTKEERVKLVFGVKIEIENPSFALKPGMPADASIDTGAEAPP